MSSLGRQFRRAQPLRTDPSFKHGQMDRSFVHAPGTVPSMPFVGTQEHQRIDMGKPLPPTDWSDLDTEEMVKVPFYHQSRLQKWQFMGAPFLHLGSEKSAKDRGAYFEGSQIHGFRLNPFTSIHKEVLNDIEANEAHAQALENRGLAIPGAIFGSRVGQSFAGEPVDLDKIGRAVEALGKNSPVIYDNSAEGAMHWHPLDRRRLSIVVPSPRMNLMGRYAKKNVHPSPLLPMDYTEMTEGELTKKHRRLRQQGIDVVSEDNVYYN